MSSSDRDANVFQFAASLKIFQGARVREGRSVSWCGAGSVAARSVSARLPITAGLIAAFRLRLPVAGLLFREALIAQPSVRASDPASVVGADMFGG